jgi:hypothetical protein
MIAACLLTAAALIAGGTVLGYLVLVCLAIHREEADRTIKTHRPDRLSCGARAANGLHVRVPEEFMVTGREPRS